jgi:hypothetical protein
VFSAGSDLPDGVPWKISEYLDNFISAAFWLHTVIQEVI